MEIAYVAVMQGKSYGGSFALDCSLHLFGDNLHQNARMPPATTHLVRQVNVVSHGLPRDVIPVKRRYQRLLYAISFILP
jgi:hypothetical protein